MTGLTIDEFHEFSRDGIPLAGYFGFRTEAIGDGTARVRMPFQKHLLRPGGTIAGPALMALADFGMYAVLLGVTGQAKAAVTANLNINFLRKPTPTDIIANGRVLRMGRRLAVIEITLHCQDEAEPVAHVTGSYAMPTGWPSPQSAGPGI